ncbi:MAG: 16S rRNA (uracil(1498)-N(3))-methyltransferase [Candidatus Aminicenantes bacterium]|nr:MAG: 16S rRNA (uracil(1498)-N(3))-methyltransferase [Candidatus Aminicenantes bacterium]
MDLHPRRALGAATMKHPPWLLASPGELVAGRIVVLDSMEARHVAGPLRMRLGDRVFVTDGAGAVASGTLSLQGRSAAEVSIDAVEDRTPSAPGLTLAVALLAGSAMDLVIQKAVELGVERLLPVGCQRSQIGLKRAMTRMDHWHRIARQALKQCHRAWAMELAIPRPLAELIDGAEAEYGVVAHPEGGSIEELPPGRGRLLLIGPEGGFSLEEERAFSSAGWPRVRLGRYVLRAETAAVAGAALFAPRF